MLRRSATLDYLRVPHGNRLEALRGDRKGQHSVRINDQFRICLYGPLMVPRTLKSSTTTEGSKNMRKVPYPHPGEILLEEFLKPVVIPQYRLAKEIGVSQRRISEIVAGTRSVTADTGLRLSRFFGMSDDFWVGLQLDF